MMLDIKYWSAPIPEIVEHRIIQFAEKNDIGEKYDTACDMVYTMQEAGEIVAVIAFKQVLFTDGRVIPRWEHIILSESVRRNKKGLFFLLTVEQQIRELGFSQLWAYINKVKQDMFDYAIKFGFKPYSKDNNGDYLSKDITKRKRF